MVDSYTVVVIALIIIAVCATALAIYGWMLEKEVKRLKKELEQKRSDKP